jgi:ribosomal protein L7/L12
MNLEVLIILLISAAAFLLVMRMGWLWDKDRHQKFFDLPKRPTLFDVKAQLEKGDKDTAIQTYGRIYSVSFEEAKKAVEDLERNLRH